MAGNILLRSASTQAKSGNVSKCDSSDSSDSSDSRESQDRSDSRGSSEQKN